MLVEKRRKLAKRKLEGRVLRSKEKAQRQRIGVYVVTIETRSKERKRTKSSAGCT